MSNEEFSKLLLNESPIFQHSFCFSSLDFRESRLYCCIPHPGYFAETRYDFGIFFHAPVYFRLDNRDFLFGCNCSVAHLLINRKRDIHQSVFNRLESENATFTSCTSERHNGSKILGTFKSAKTSGNLLLYFEHAKAAFREIIIEGNAEVSEEKQIFVFVNDEAINKRTCLTTLRPSSL